MWDLPRPGLEPVSPALAGGFLTTVPAGKPSLWYFFMLIFIQFNVLFDFFETSSLTNRLLLVGNYKCRCYKHSYWSCVHISFQPICVNTQEHASLIILYDYVLLCKKPSKHLPKWLYYFSLPPEIYQSFCCSIGSSVLGFASVLDFSHSDRYIVVSHSNLQFHNVIWYWKFLYDLL